MEQPVHLFVYGTLLTAADHPMGQRLRESADLHGHGWIRGCLYTIEDPEDPGNIYPGAVPSGFHQDRVYGEVYALADPEPVLAAFDIYEACDPSRPEPHEFQRRRVPVTLESGVVISAVSYLYGWDLSRATRIHSGRFDRVMPDAR